MNGQVVSDVLIIGGGVSGTALLYQLARFTDLKRITLLEKYASVAAVNSNGRNNSQTLHCGDIETNYTLEKARQVQRTAAMLVNYASPLPMRDQIMFRHQKMVIGVGEQECATLAERFNIFSAYFPAMQLLDEKAIQKLEPNVVKGRREMLNGIGIVGEYTAVNFATLSESFVEQACGQRDREVDVCLSTYVSKIEKQAELYQVTTNRGQYQARFVVVCAGGHSLLFAHRMGYGHYYSCLPMAGSFYYTPKCLNGKVYTVQNDKLPFAAIHGDPDILLPDKTRLGPTALVVPMLERYNLKTLPEFFQVLRLDHKVLLAFWKLFRVADIRHYILRNILFEVPGIRRRLFLKDARKVIPLLQLADLQFAKGIGGVRPVMIDKREAKLHLGEAKIDTGNGIIFNMTPSPGATSCLGNAEKDMRIIAGYIGCSINEARFEERLGSGRA
ncbi:MAG TPA: FAD-dependent oxidoreductase [Gammaproteobacteria bacterium]|nr:FAD-dependent oxidoreductase [Gammaproteobacteria bacterium]